MENDNFTNLIVRFSIDFGNKLSYPNLRAPSRVWFPGSKCILVKPTVQTSKDISLHDQNSNAAQTDQKHH